jgi:Mrp family chromosome partitioning ATPase
MITTTSFEESLYKAKEILLMLLPQTEAYLVSNIYTKLALYVVDATTEKIDALKVELSGLISNVATIKNDDFIHRDLQIGKEYVGDESSKLFFVNRHIDKSNWYLTPHTPIPRRASVVAFYSFKGGLGRTTALVLSALQLTRQGKKVALVDFDLEAPGLGPLFQPDFPEIAAVRGTADFLLDWQAREQISNDINI